MLEEAEYLNIVLFILEYKFIIKKNYSVALEPEKKKNKKKPGPAPDCNFYMLCDLGQVKWA